MNLFGIGALELLFILIIALIIVGPKDIEKHARSAGRFLNRFYRSDTWRLMRDTSRNIRSLPSRLAREAALEELEDIKRSIEDTTGNLDEVRHRLEQTEKKLSDSSQASGDTDVNSTKSPSAAEEKPKTEDDR